MLTKNEIFNLLDNELSIGSPSVNGEPSLEEQAEQEAIRRASQPYTAYASNPVDWANYNIFAPFGSGIADSMNKLVGGGLGFVLGNIGRGIEAISPSNRRDEAAREELRRMGASDEYINNAVPRQDSWATSLAKDILAGENFFEDRIKQNTRKFLGDNPNQIQSLMQGSGTSIGYLLPMLALRANPLTAAFVGGAGEALSEAGGFMGDAYRNSQYDDGALSAANKGFAANTVLNTGLNYLLSPVGILESNVKNPVGRYLTQSLSETLNELLQEPSQQVIEQAAKNSLDNGTGFLSELGESVKQWPETFAQLAPEVAGSTLITQAVLSPLGIKLNREYNNDLGKAKSQIADIKSQLESIRERADNNSNDEFAKLLKDSAELETQINSLGFNDPKGLGESFVHLDNIRNAINNYGKSIEQIQQEKQAESIQPSITPLGDQETPAVEPVAPSVQHEPLPNNLIQPLNNERDRLQSAIDDKLLTTNDVNVEKNQAELNSLFERINRIENVINNGDVTEANNILREIQEANTPFDPNTADMEELQAEHDRLQALYEDKLEEQNHNNSYQLQEELKGLLDNINNIDEAIKNYGSRSQNVGLSPFDLDTESKSNNTPSMDDIWSMLEKNEDKNSYNYDEETPAMSINEGNEADNKAVKENSEEGIRQNVKQQIINVGRSEEEAEGLSHLYIAHNKYFAKYTGKSLEDIVRADNLKIVSTPDMKDNSGRDVRARTEFLPERRNMFGDIEQEAQTLIRVSKMADQSSIVHEMGHLFLKKFHKLKQAGLLTGLAKHDWNTILNAYGLSEIDFNNMSDADTSAWREAHEKFATDFERYMRTGEAPSSKLKHVFAQFKRWLSNIYKSLKDIKYVGSDGQEHSFELSPEIKQVFDHLLGENEGESYNQSSNNDNTDNFITPEEIERFNQHAYHGTGHIIKGNKFKLNKSGSGEGGAAFGYGAYLAQNRAVSETYRKYGLSDTDIILSNGKKYSMLADSRYDDSIKPYPKNDYLRAVLSHIGDEIKKDNSLTLAEIKENLSRNYEKHIQQHNDEIKKLKIEAGKISDKSSWEYKKLEHKIAVAHGAIYDFKKYMKTLDKVSGLSYKEGRKGNIYEFDIPEDYELLDLDTSFNEQPLKVREAMSSILSELSVWGYDVKKLRKTFRDEGFTGQKFYNALSYLFNSSRADNHFPEIERSDARASYMLNKFGIPGLRFWDRQSRSDKEGTHNFVIWNTKTLKMLGLTEDSDEDAKEYFEKTKTKKSGVESYNQIIGEKGARELDKQEGTTNRIDNLSVAKEMTETGKDAKTIRLATGWEKAIDGKWRWEILDGDFDWLKIHEQLENRSVPLSDYAENMKLNEVFKNKELFTAYPELNKIRVLMWDKLENNAYGSYNDSEKEINLAMNHKPEQIKSTLIHEIQHAIQNIEGFAQGGSPEQFYSNKIRLRDYTSQVDFLQKVLLGEYPNLHHYTDSEIENQIKDLERRIDEIKENALDGMVEVDGQVYEDEFDAYEHLGGEVEARNVQKRKDFTAEQRRNTLLADTQDTDEWIEVYNQIGIKRKKEMESALEKNRPDMTQEQRADAISEIEKLGESVKEGGHPKTEKAAIKWLLNGHIILPEDNYKILDAIKICEQEHLDPIRFTDPNEILAKYTIKKTKAEKRINPDTVPEFSNKQEYDNDITIYTVEDSKAGQAAVRKIIDTHWGEDANPWCLAARHDGTLDSAWDFWERYNGIEKRIAFKNGELLAFSANDEGGYYADEYDYDDDIDDNGEFIQWWDKQDIASNRIPHIEKKNGNVVKYELFENKGRFIKTSEELSNGTKCKYYENEKLKSEELPDGTRREFLDNGILKKEVLSDGSQRQYSNNGELFAEVLPDKTVRWYSNGKMNAERLPDGTYREYDENGKLISEEKEETYNQAIAANDEAIDSQEQIDAVRKQYEGTYKWLKAPNGKKSNLSERQWLQVRTLNFKRWFGDWETVANARPSVIANTRQEANEVLENLRNKELKSVAEDITATISKEGRKKIVSSVAVNKSIDNGFSAKDHFTAVANIEKLFENSIKSNERSDDNGQLKAIEHFSSLLMLEDNPALATFTVKVTENAGRKIYSIEVMNLSGVEGTLPGNVVKTHRASSTPDMLNISRIADTFNNASKVVDENGEPLVVYHGTPNGDFSIFDYDKISTHTKNKGRYGTGFYFTEFEKSAKNYSYNSETGEYSDIKETFLNIRNPFIWDEKEAQKLGYPNMKKRAVQVVPTDKEITSFTRNLKNNGYDGVLVQDFIKRARDGTADNPIAKYWNTEIVAFYQNQIKSATDNRGSFDSGNPDIYYQAAFSPHKELVKRLLDWLKGKDIDERAKGNMPISSAETTQQNNEIRFENEETERRYKEAENGVQELTAPQKVKRATLRLLRSMKGDFPELAGNKEFNFAREELRKLGRAKSAQVHEAMKTFTQNLEGLSNRRRDLFGRMRLLDDLMWRKGQVPDAELPFGFTDESLKKEYEKFSKLVKNEPAVMKAIQAEEQTMQKISKEFVDLAGQLGLKLDGVFKNPHYFRHSILEYANAAAVGAKKSKTEIHSGHTLQDLVDQRLNEIKNRSFMKKYKGSSLDINTNYTQAMGEVRAQMLMDIETMKTLIKIKEKYDVAPKFRESLKKAFTQRKGDNETHNQGEGVNLSDIIPEGYTLYNPAGSRLIQSANTTAENALAMAIDDASETLGLPLDEVINSMNLTDEEAFNQLWVIPNEIKETLKKMSKGRDRGILGNTAKSITTAWKKLVLFSPTRNLKYNFRNFTGDLDAVIAGNPSALKFFKQSVKELTEHFRGKNTTQDLKDYMQRSGGMNVESMSFNDKEIKELQSLAEILKDEKASIPKKGWNLIKKFFANEVAFTEWREHLLRYAAYLSYKQDMDKNNGTPSTWGASIKDEVLSLNDNRDKAYKMSNELLGAYDQVSETGKQLREMLIPFYSWMEVNMKRYYRLLKNGFSGDNSFDFTKRLLMGQTARVPFYALTAAETFGKIALLTIAVQMFNRMFFEDDDDELPNDVKYRPHLTLGKYNGKVYYFDRIGALADAADWLNLDSIFLDAKELANGQQSLGGYVKKMAQAPVNKIINGLNPILKMPIELATGRTMYPDAFNSRTIRDNGKYIAQSLGLSWPYKALTGEPRNDLDELTNMVVYSLDPDEAAYFQTLDKVRQFQERVLDKKFDGFATTKRGQVLQNLKRALRYKDTAAVRRYLKEYAKLDGTKKGLKQSMAAMNPLFGLTQDEKKQFMKWITAEDRKYLKKADRYFHALADRYLK